MAHENRSPAIGVVRRCSVKQMFLKISENSQENTCARVYFSTKSLFLKKETLAQMFSCECVKISKNTFPYRTSPVAASLVWNFCGNAQFPQIFR